MDNFFRKCVDIAKIGGSVLSVNNNSLKGKQMTELFDSISLVEDLDGFSVYGSDDDFMDEDNEGSFVIRGKYILDGAETLEEAADMARAYAEFLDELIVKGFELRGIIDNDYGFAKPNS